MQAYLILSKARHHRYPTSVFAYNMGAFITSNLHIREYVEFAYNIDGIHFRNWLGFIFRFATKLLYILCLHRCKKQSFVNLKELPATIQDCKQQIKRVVH